MDYLKRLRELPVWTHAVCRRGWWNTRVEGSSRSWLHTLRDRLPTDCLLCRARSPGSLCGHCYKAVCASMVAKRPRCPRCDLALVLPASSQPEVSAGGGIVEEAVRSAAARLGIPARHDRAAESVSADDAGCPDCRALSPSFERAVAVFDYGGPGELLIQRLKGQGRFSSAPVLAAMLAERCRQARGASTSQEPLWGECGTLVVPVPASRRALILRGYNPAAEVGRDLARRVGLPWRPDLLRRVRDGHDQKGLGRRARQREVAGLYRCTDSVAGQEILIVDDVMTTGSTLDAVARVLKENGAVKVWGAVVARTPLRGERR